MPRLLSVNVGLPRDIEWQGRIVHTGIWKSPVRGSCRVRRLNLDGDGQGDLAGHGGEHRAVFVYQMESYRYWQVQLKRDAFELGQFGENFTIEGLSDDAVCIGDRYRIGSALFEVTQPRVTCYRIAIRMNEPRIPALLTSSGRPGFYFRVLVEGEVRAGDEIVKVGEAGERMTIAEINALLYLPPHPPERLIAALKIPALAPGWRHSFEALLAQDTNAGSGNAGLAPSAASHRAVPGFRELMVTAVEQESVDVFSLTLQSAGGQPLPLALPGQYVVLRLARDNDKHQLFRSYSLSGAVSAERYRISVKLEPNGAAGSYLQDRARAGTTLTVSAPRGSFTLASAERPVVLLSAGIGVTPVLAMLHALASARSTRQVWWLHAARDGQHHPFAEEARRLMRVLARGRAYICYSAPRAGDEPGRDFDATGHFSGSTFAAIGVSSDSEVYVCGPSGFMAAMKDALANLGIAPERIHTEIFQGGASMTPGIVGATKQAPHPPKHDSPTGPLVSFARSGIAAHWNGASYRSILALAEACDVPVRWSCRAGVCHNCESGLVSGEVAYDPAPLDAPAFGNVLLCCARPTDDVVIDL